jgi:hypothetical protein
MRGWARHFSDSKFADHRLLFSLLLLLLLLWPNQNPTHNMQRYLQLQLWCQCVKVGIVQPQSRSSYVTVWDADDIWLFQGTRSWVQWGVVHRSYVLLVCRKF